MTAALHLTPAARVDVINAALHISENDLDAADRFLDAVEHTFATIQDHPNIGVARDFANPSLAGLRMLPVRGFRNFLIFYRLTQASLDILRVLHAARDIEHLFEAT